MGYMKCSTIVAIVARIIIIIHSHIILDEINWIVKTSCFYITGKSHKTLESLSTQSLNMSQSTRSSMLLNFLLLTILALSSLGSSRPVSKSGNGLSRSDIHSRSASPSPRVVPSNGEYRERLMKDIFDSLGLSALNKLDDWKKKLEDSDVIDDSNSPSNTVTEENNASIVDEPKNGSDDEQTEDTPDTVDIVDDILSTMIDKFHEAFLTQDELTLI
ncbi:uncharacterized protein NFIA_015410 [Aspergillus fischeri NRRL 181]|uniref:Uncharacterized protein n=1 Tax=Neosartorya fischeri (strain ATCC 1020 / DSM 3700 / CBS 544.65 / FGSC A1164 / JCM 1740 / NRRL 181 / WB 181) TaxID=331117 RepID=A1D355_NEOFI|nr:conserved hypothetical protein [Aspergillus fischeri NRRL 181]EAW22848.1 conserved hypothetical protein [Aspergillus fischeri NRRL 181]